MKATLYEQAKDVERMDEKLRDLNSSNQIDVIELQRNLFQRYEENPVFYDAMQDRISIGDSLSELAQINKSGKRFFPRRKNKSHNERIEQIGELISNPHYLKTHGILIPDNFVGGIALVAACAYGVSNLVMPYLMGEVDPNIDPAEIQNRMESMKTVMPAFMTLVMGPFFGTGMQLQRSGSLPVGEAKYLDEKVQEFYK
tara:strand:+ start:33 stop:629 length:597 start_codon:yes stop_codon:yes gene_type:complete